MYSIDFTHYPLAAKLVSDHSKDCPACGAKSSVVGAVFDEPEKLGWVDIQRWYDCGCELESRNGFGGESIAEVYDPALALECSHIEIASHRGPSSRVWDDEVVYAEFEEVD